MITTLRIDGMRSVHCVRAVFTALGAIEGIASADVAMGSARIEHVTQIDIEPILESLTSLGYHVREVSTDRRRLTIRNDAHPTTNE